MRDYRMSQAELMAYSYAFGTCMLIAAVVYDGSMAQALIGVSKAAPLSIYLIVGLTTCGFFGINFVMTLVKVRLWLNKDVLLLSGKLSFISFPNH